MQWIIVANKICDYELFRLSTKWNICKMVAKRKKKYVLKTKNPSLFTRKISDRNKLSPKKESQIKLKQIIYLLSMIKRLICIKIC